MCVHVCGYLGAYLCVLCEVCIRTCVYGNADAVCWFVCINVRMCV